VAIALRAGVVVMLAVTAASAAYIYRASSAIPTQIQQVYALPDIWRSVKP
jgi:hypothetical protein